MMTFCTYSSGARKRSYSLDTCSIDLAARSTSGAEQRHKLELALHVRKELCWALWIFLPLDYLGMIDGKVEALYEVWTVKFPCYVGR
jgi:hypothetical protein